MWTRAKCAVAVVLLAGCGGSSSGSSPGIATVREFCSSYLETAGSLMARCVGGTEAYWRDVYATLFPCDALAANVDAGTMTYRGSSAQACLAAIENLGCTSLSTSIPECEQTLEGNVAVGGTCDSETISACVPEAVCRTQANACSGTCIARVPVNGSCAATTSISPPCAEGASCVNGVCAANAGEGQSCGGPSGPGCAGNLRCVGETSIASGTCGRGSTSGPCTTSSDCDTYYTCAGATGARTCSKYRMLGEDCVPGERQCWLLLRCGSDGKCSDARAAANEACGIDANGEYVLCGAGLYCSYVTATTAGSCVAQKAAGASCASDSECAGTNAYCDSTTARCVACS